jgi:hypothetical protein
LREVRGDARCGRPRYDERKEGTMKGREVKPGAWAEKVGEDLERMARSWRRLEGRARKVTQMLEGYETGEFVEVTEDLRDALTRLANTLAVCPRLYQNPPIPEKC